MLKHLISMNKVYISKQFDVLRVILRTLKRLLYYVRRLFLYTWTR